VSESHKGYMYQTMSDSIPEVEWEKRYSINKMKLRPTMSNFMDVPQIDEIELRDIFEKYQREYEDLRYEFDRSMYLI
jgi:hypothetical protein